jgi:hypothetical protein
VRNAGGIERLYGASRSERQTVLVSRASAEYAASSRNAHPSAPMSALWLLAVVKAPISGGNAAVEAAAPHFVLGPLALCRLKASRKATGEEYVTMSGSSDCGGEQRPVRATHIRQGSATHAPAAATLGCAEGARAAASRGCLSQRRKTPAQRACGPI